MKNKTALYLRLSRDDGTESESESITNQKLFLLDYADKNNLDVVEIFTDDGFSGTNFNRPDFIRMKEAIESGKINTVVTKDLSRLGRDYIGTGFYLEQYFPMHSVRYIAVNDGIDTETPAKAGDMTPFKAVFNDMYAKDISQKVRTALSVKKEQGKFIGANPPYGYKKDPEDKNHLIIDEEAAENVRWIFKKFLSGESVIGIAHKLSENKIPTPSQYKKLTATQKNFKGIWNDTIVRRILTNPTYAGHLTQNISRKINYKLNKRVKIPKSDWITVKNTHEPIVSEKDFEAVAEILEKRGYRKRARGGAEHLLSGLVFCKDCGGKMTFVKEAETRTYLVCSRWRKNARLGICTSHSIRESYLEEIIKEELSKFASVINVAEIRREAEAFFTEKKKDEKLISRLEQKIAVCKDTMLSLYKDKAMGRITEAEYDEMSEGIKEERQIWEKRISEIKEENSRENTNADLTEFLATIVDFSKVDRNTLVMLIDRIYVGKNKEIEIIFKFNTTEKI